MDYAPSALPILTNNMLKEFLLIDYKGKYDIVFDPDMVDDLDIVVGKISRDAVIRDAANRKEASRYYGIPAYVGKDEELKSLFK